MANHVPVIFGTAAVGNNEPFIAEADLNNVFDTLKKHNVHHIDSAQIYGKSEERLGQVKAGDSFTIDTKWYTSFVPGQVPPAWANREQIVRSAKESIARLGVSKANIFYLHAPDNKTPIEETLAGVDEVYRLGLFTKFGLSNFTADAVQNVYDVATAKGYVKPTVYQGNYSAAARRSEKELLPTLRKLGIAYYAYSPIAGGLLTKTPEQLQAGAGRFSPGVFGGLYSKLYNKPAYLAALKTWGEIAADEGVPLGELAFRWAASNSALSNEHGDAVIIGARNAEQIDQTLTWIEKGPLSDKAVQAIDGFWKAVEKEAPLDNFNA